MTENQYDEDDLFQSRKDDKNQYSTFIQELQQSTQKLMNQVFNTQYVPQINHNDLHLNDLQNIEKNKQSLLQSSTPKTKKNFTSHDFNTSKRSNATKCTQSQKQISQSFNNFLIRNDKWKQRRVMRAKNQHNKKEEDQLRNLTFIPNILQVSRQKVIQPIYERCLDIQKQKQKKLAFKRIEKQREQHAIQSQFTFQPTITTKAKNRTLEEYLKDKQEWNSKKIEYIENQKLWQQARRNEQCIFRPILITQKYTNKKVNKSQIECPQRVQDRLLRSLEKSIQRRQQIKNKNEVRKIKAGK